MNYSKPNNRSIKDSIINVAMTITEIAVSIIEAVSIIGGIIGANIADIAFGTIALNFMFSGSNLLVAGVTPVLYMSLAVSAGTSAIQIYLWTLLRKRGIGLKEIWNFKKLPSDLKYFLVGAGAVWLGDTILDISPLSLLMRGSLFEGSPMYDVVKVVIYFLVFLLCGFAEPLTANMNQMLEGGRVGGNKPAYNNTNNTNNTGNTYKPPQSNNQQNKNGSQTPYRPAPKPVPNQSLPTFSEPTYHPVGMTSQSNNQKAGSNNYFRQLEEQRKKNKKESISPNIMDFDFEDELNEDGEDQ